MAEIIPLSALARPTPGGDPARLERAISRKIGQAIADFELIGEGDRIMVCVSGGKDSYALLDMLQLLQQRAPVTFELLAVNVDQGWPDYRTDVIEAHLAARGVPYQMIREDIASVVEANLEPDDTPCSLCSRLRRGVLYNLAARLGCTKIALGHHMDDVLETLVLNMFYSGRLAAMPARLRSDDGRNTVIRPMVYVPEALLVDYAQARAYPVVRCACPTCGLPEQKRQVVKRMLADLEAEDPGLKQRMLGAVRNVKPSHLLDGKLSRFGADI
jgi:tRNA 2-thiocytidine biosynthesis protein TtcA